MAGTVKRTNPGDAANVFVRCMLSDISDLLGGFSKEDLDRTVDYFDYKCPYTGEDISVEYRTGKWALDHLIPHNRESVGLNLYGNIIVTTRTTNSAKAAKSYEDFIRYETKGTQEEKETRIQKIRAFQKESGYFDKVKNIDEIKELCKKEYDSIQKKLKDHITYYESILGKKKEVVENHPEKSCFIRNNQVQNCSNISNIEKSNSKENAMTKSMAKRLFRNCGFPVSGNVTFSSENNSYGRKFWANPKLDLLCGNWWLILNDIDKRRIHLFFIPANAIKEGDVIVRADKPELIDIQINYDDDLFLDSRSKISFRDWFVKSIEY